ncbi:MAG: transcription elongation factor GreA [Lachnospiraceae bacterium]|jgi:transcription elongation factor GreA|nr:transcription elongation factor GreA [Lachnospiraceae bacterium]MCI6664704.1 transcription elongation factor GreA [Lachnospiraceae bacterium]MDD7223361.1 transcription elongation factor GreA [Lachnospiraceae bacterium]MDO4510044.1 transcription elongation factor GreA [Lachnospiraceae bacterium]MDY3255135.1 transcription elongation factor GreA [Lachnospiraceae bacterium]
MRDNLTKSDIEKMEAEIEHRKVVVRHELLEHVKTARAQGDLSENFEYYAAKKEKNKNESRIRYLERMIRTANVVDDSSADDEVGINNTVTVEFIEDKETETYRIVTTVRVDTFKNMISIDSPLGKALMGHKVGDIVNVKVNENVNYDVKILEIDNTTDDSQDEINKF